MSEIKRGPNIHAIFLSSMLSFGVATACSPLDLLNKVPQSERLPSAISSSSFYNQEVISQIKDLEKSYKRQDLKDQAIRTRHLELVARFYIFEPLEKRTPQELIDLIDWLPKSRYDSRFPQSGFAVADPQTRRIFLREEGFAFTRTGVGEIFGSAQYASALSVARVLYEQQWNFHEGYQNQRAGDTDPLWHHYFPSVLNLRKISGFTLEFTDLRQIPDHLLETVFAVQSAASMERRYFGVNPNLVLPEGGPRGHLNRLINIGVGRAEQLFSKRPDLEATFRQFHQKSDLLGFARFLGSISTLTFPTQEDRDRYGLEVVKSLISDESKAKDVFTKYLANIR